MPNKGAMQLGGGWSSACHSRPGRVRPYKVAPATRMWFVHRTKGSQVVSKDQLGIRTLVTRAPNVREQEALKTEKVVLVRDVIPVASWEEFSASLPCSDLGRTRLRGVDCTIYQQEQIAFFPIDNKVHYDNTPRRQGDRRGRREVGRPSC